MVIRCLYKMSSQFFAFQLCSIIYRDNETEGTRLRFNKWTRRIPLFTKLLAFYLRPLEFELFTLSKVSFMETQRKQHIVAE